MAEKKFTKAEILMNIRTVAEQYDYIGEIPADAVIAYCDTTLAQMNRKNEKAREKAAEKKAEGDALTETIFGLVTEEWQTADEIVAAIGNEEVTKGKVTARLGKLVTAERVVKENRKVEGDAKRKVMHYRLATAVDAE